jgi:phosphatidylserine decarboxylase
MKTEIILKEGYPFIIGSGSLFLLSLIFHFNGFLQLILFLIFAFFVYFFRNPERIPEDEKAIISPSDGEVIEIVKTKAPLINAEMIKISIRLSLFDVHVQRAPIEGKMSAREYIHGTFLSLNSEKASELNEQNRVLFENEKTKIVVNQIAGFLTRRIVMFTDLGNIKLAQRYGMIMFGSQVDIYVPVNTEIKVTEFEKLKAGESVIGYLYED